MSAGHPAAGSTAKDFSPSTLYHRNLIGPPPLILYSSPVFLYSAWPVFFCLRAKFAPPCAHREGLTSNERSDTIAAMSAL